MGIKKRIAALDKAATTAVVHFRQPVATTLFRLISFSGSSKVWFGSSALFMLLIKLGIPFVGRPVTLLACMLGAFFSLISGQLLKRLIRRKRPYLSMPNHQTLTRRPTDASMPSTHSATAVALAVGLFFSGHFLWPVIAVWAVLVVYSRVYLGVHYVGDVLAGALWGAFFGLWNYEDVVIFVLQLNS